MKATKKVPRRPRGRKRHAHSGNGMHAFTERRRLALEIEPVIHRLGDGIEALQAAGTAVDAIAPAVVAWFAETLRVDFEALRRIVGVPGAHTGSLRRGRRRS